MTMKLFPWGKHLLTGSFIFILFIGFALHIVAAENQLVSVKTEKGHSEIVFHLPPKVQVKVLNSSPAQKLLIKITSPGLRNDFQPYYQPEIPELSGIAGFRQLPLQKNSRLLVFEFKKNLKFLVKSRPTPRIILQDESFFDPWEVMYQKAVKLQKEGKLDKALALYRKIIFRNRRHGNAYFKAGQIRFAKGQYHLAEINFKHALRLKCDSLGLYRDMAKLYQKLGNFTLARKYRKIFQQQYSQKPDNSPGKPPVMSLQTAPASPSRTTVQQDTQSVPEKATSTTTPQPSGKKSHKSLLVYLLGIVLLFGFVVYRLISSIQKRISSRPMFELPRDFDLEKNREKILHTARTILQEAEKNQKAAVDSPVQTEQAKVPAESSQTSEAAPIEETEQPLLSAETANDTGIPDLDLLDVNEPSDRLKLARSLNLGVGELELALNLKAHQRNVHRSISREEQIARLHAHHLDIAEIARRMRIGQGEVEFYLAMQEKRKNAIRK